MRCESRRGSVRARCDVARRHRPRQHAPGAQARGTPRTRGWEGESASPEAEGRCGSPARTGRRHRLPLPPPPPRAEPSRIRIGLRVSRYAARGGPARVRARVAFASGRGLQPFWSVGLSVSTKEPNQTSRKPTGGRHSTPRRRDRAACRAGTALRGRRWCLQEGSEKVPRRWSPLLAGPRGRRRCRRSCRRRSGGGSSGTRLPASGPRSRSGTRPARAGGAPLRVGAGARGRSEAAVRLPPTTRVRLLAPMPYPVAHRCYRALLALLPGARLR